MIPDSPLLARHPMTINSYQVCFLRLPKSKSVSLQNSILFSKHRFTAQLLHPNGIFLPVSEPAPPSSTRAVSNSPNNTLSLASEVPFEGFREAPLRSVPHRHRLPGISLCESAHESPHSLVDPECLSILWIPFVSLLGTCFLAA
jgi:hypothetical protein